MPWTLGSPSQLLPTCISWIVSLWLASLRLPPSPAGELLQLQPWWTLPGSTAQRHREPWFRRRPWVRLPGHWGSTAMCCHSRQGTPSLCGSVSSCIKSGMKHYRPQMKCWGRHTSITAKVQSSAGTWGPDGACWRQEAARGGSRPWRATGSRLAPCQKQLQNWKNTQNYFQTLAYRWHRVWFLKAEQTQAPQSLHSTYKGTSGTPEQETEPTLCVLGLLSWRHKDWSLGTGRLRQQTPVDQRTKEGEATQSNLHGAPFGGLLTCTQTSWDLKRQDGNPLPGEGQLRRHCRWN